MNSRLALVNIVRWFVLLLIQILLLRNLSFYNMATPFVYIIFLLLLPFNTPNILLYLIAFVTGLTLDAFYDTLGVHTAACVALAFVRILFISVTMNRDGFDEPEPTLGNMGFKWFIIYAFLCTMAHHLVLFFLETFRLAEFSYTLLRCFFSIIFTLFTVVLIEFIFYNRKMR
ncbi:MAG: rod shape-determining protein MreD [Candidatus Pedobacter colombiensis]|uniref:Rod shape-determining protein MreD n=1 Tax=Candidatus Pedobacter colombiensis TaxID=3121371 RepID=A0AAJ6B7A7_9SPHI|nr:rod shape-determining protein MreD [Pedobacter sp.]WEK20055.1 MAG: rod shape-determining protein MreD [Pedobacter sp.]